MDALNSYPICSLIASITFWFVSMANSTPCGAKAKSKALFLMLCRDWRKTKPERDNTVMKRMMLLVTAALTTASVFAQSGKTMKAVVVHEFGGPEVLKYEDAPRPQPKENEILVRVIAAGGNPVEHYIR